MVIAITVLHIMVSLGLILVVLLQTGKADMGAVFGGSSSTIFGSSGAGNFLTKLTTAMAIVFMITSLTLGYFAGHRPAGTIFDSGTPPAQTPAAQPDELPTQPSKETGPLPEVPASSQQPESKKPTNP